MADLLVTNSLTFFSYEYLYFLFISEEQFPRYRIAVNSSLFQPLKMLCTSFWPPMVSDEKPAVIRTGVHLQAYGNMLFFSGCFEDFFFPFVFSLQKFNYDVSWHGFACTYIFWGLFSFWNLYVSVFLPNLRSFQLFFFFEHRL